MNRKGKNSLSAIVRKKNAPKKRLEYQQNVPDASRSAEKVELLLEHAVADYNYLTTDFRTFQNNYIRSHLWLSIVLLTLCSVLFVNILEYSIPVPFLHGAPSLWFYSFATMTLFTQCCTLVIGINSIQDRENTLLAIGDYNIKLQQLCAKRGKNYESVLRSMLESYQQCIAFEISERTKVKATIKDMSRLLIISICFAIASIGIFAMTPANSDNTRLHHEAVEIILKKEATLM